MKTSRTFILSSVVALGAAAASHLFAGNSFGPRIVVKVGDPVPGVIGATFTSFDAPVINNEGTVAFKAAFTGGGATATTNEAIFAGPPNAPVVRVREGGASPVLVEAFVFLDPRVVLADDGNLFNAAQLSGVTVTTANDRVLIVNGGLANDTILLRESDPLGGTLAVAPTGLNFEPLSGVLFANRDGHAAVVAGITDTAAPGAGRFAVLHLNGLDWNDVIAFTGGPAPEDLGTFVPEFAGQNPFDLRGVGPLGGTTYRGRGQDVELGVFESFFHFDPVTSTTRVMVKTGDKAKGAKPNRFFAELGDPAVTGGGSALFDVILQEGQDGPPLFDERALIRYEKYKTALAALRDRSAKKTGGVFAGFPACVVNQNGTAAFLADLFKRPDGFPPGQTTGVFGGPGKPQLIAQAGNPVPGLPETTITSFDFGGLTVTNGGEVFVLCTVAENQRAVLKSRFPSNGRVANSIFLQDALSVPVGVGNDVINAFDFPFGRTTCSDGKPRSVNDSGTAVIECVFATNGNCVYFTGTPKVPENVRQPDIILNETEKVGDDVHQSKAESPQTPEREQPVNVEMDYPFFIQNDGSVQDEIKFTSSGSNARDRFKWFEGEGDATEISDAVFGDGRTYTLAPGDKVRVRLRANRQTLENKGKTDKIKMKAESTADKKARDAFQISIVFKPTPP